jgi:ParB family chromosome partitioning protein
VKGDCSKRRSRENSVVGRHWHFQSGHAEMQRELLKAYEGKQLNYMSLRMVRRLIEKRRLLGKQNKDGPRSSRTSAETIVANFRKETERQKLMIKKSRICDARLLNVVTAFNKLVADEHFLTLLRAEVWRRCRNFFGLN